MIAGQFIGNRYELGQLLGSGGMGIVYRALDRLSGQLVALKQVTTTFDSLLDTQKANDSSEKREMRVALAYEFKTLASLRHPHIISVLDYGFDTQRQPFFTMDLLEDAQHFEQAGREEPLTAQVNLLIQLLEALNYLHRRGILHRDLKPGNVLVVKKQVKVLDFGLATAKGEEGSSGTLAYMAPEYFQELPIRETADLYAVGVMAYEMVTGTHPFLNDNITRMVSDVLTKAPDLALLSNKLTGTADENIQVAAVIERLLAKNPDDRYPTAEEVIKALNQAVGNPPRQETIAIRESFLESATFVGREKELSTLTLALKQMLGGPGSAWLIGGESGVGKSRLLDELRAQALVQGVMVLRGQSVAEGSGNYGTWREVLRRLVLQVELTAMEASVIKALVPDIANFVNDAVPDAPTLEPQANQARLFSIVEHIIESQPEPLLIVLEDLQWAGTETLALMNYLSRRIEALKLVLIGSYRDDEHSTLPQELPDMELLKLTRFDKQNIAQLSESMLGESGRSTQVLDLLQRETEGNAFFLVEVVRALAEEAGRLDRVGATTLPERVFAGGVQLVIRRRLERVPESARGLLRLAAVAGRQLDLTLLRTLNNQQSLTNWLTVCSDAAVLDVSENVWRFTHEKVRERLLADLEPEHRKRLHQQVAEATEAVYAEMPEHAATLAYHWAAAGNTEKEAHYSLIAGERLLLNGAYEESITYLNRAISLMPLSKLQSAAVERQLGEGYYSLGQFDASRTHLERSLALAGNSVPGNPALLGLGLLGAIGGQALHRWIPATRQPASSADQREMLLEQARVYLRLEYLYGYVNGQFVRAIYSSFSGLNTAEIAGPSPELAQVYGSVTYIFGALKLHSIARVYERLSLQTAQSVTDLVALGGMNAVLGVYRVVFGKWDEAEQFTQRSADQFQEVGALRRWDEVMHQLAFIYSENGQYEKCLDAANQIINSARKRSDAQGECAGLLAQIIILLRQNRYDDAASPLDRVRELLPKDLGALTFVWAYGVLASAAVRQEQWDSAKQSVSDALKVMSGSAAINFLTLEGHSGTIEACLKLWKQNKIDQATVQQALKYMKSYAQFAALGQARSTLWQGMYQWRLNQQSAAIKSWQASLGHATTYNIPYEQALAHYALSRALPAAEQGDHAAQADKLFKQLGASNLLDSLFE